MFYSVLRLRSTTYITITHCPFLVQVPILQKPKNPVEKWWSFLSQQHIEYLQEPPHKNAVDAGFPPTGIANSSHMSI